MKLTTDLYNRLKPYENHLLRGYRGNYVYGMSKGDFEALSTIYKEAGGQATITNGCNICLLRLTKDLGRLYFDFNDVLAQQTAEPEKVAEKPKKGGRKAKK